MSYGLRYMESRQEVRLIQVSGIGRVRVICEGHKTWINPKGKPWEVFEAVAADPQTYGTREMAERVALNLRS
jgi:virulence-associated protein VagC